MAEIKKIESPKKDGGFKLESGTAISIVLLGLGAVAVYWVFSNLSNVSKAVGDVGGAIGGGVQTIEKDISTVYHDIGSFVGGTAPPEVYYAVGTSNPVSQSGLENAVKANIVATNPSYTGAKVVTTNEPLTTMQQFQAYQSNPYQPVINITPQGVGTYNPLPQGFPVGSAAGSYANPVQYGKGYIGPGAYVGVPGYAPNLVFAITNQSQYANPASSQPQQPAQQSMGTNFFSGVSNTIGDISKGIGEFFSGIKL